MIALFACEAEVNSTAAGKQNNHDNQGVNFVITGPASDAASTNITLDLKNVTLVDATERIAEVAGVRVIAMTMLLYSTRSE